MIRQGRPETTERCEPRMRTRLVHGLGHTGRWDYNHHVVPPMTASATFRLDSAKRGAQGFAEFRADDLDPQNHPPIYIYDRLDEPTRGMLEDNLAFAEDGEIAVCFASGNGARRQVQRSPTKRCRLRQVEAGSGQEHTHC